MEKIQQIDEQIKKIKAFYEVKKEDINNKRRNVKQEIACLHKEIEMLYDKIGNLKKEYEKLNVEYDRLSHGCKAATLPLRTEKYLYMENLRKEIREYQNQQNS